MANVLLVEDRRSYLGLWRAEFEGRGHKVDQARNEEAAMQKIAEQSFDAIVLGICLVDGGGSETGGLEVARWMRAHQEERLRRLPIIFTVENPDERYRKEFMRLIEEGGTGAALSRPFSTRDLRRAVEKFLPKESEGNG